MSGIGKIGEIGKIVKMQAPRGMHDILPEDAPRWRALETAIHTLAARYGYREIRTPVAEHTEVFQKTVGESSDIVEHEMYTFNDRGGRSLTLRPEGTAAVVRAYLEHGMAAGPQPARLYYIAPMFRYDRPQKGRYRMHHQFGAEIIGTPSPAADVEVLSLPVRLIQSLGLTEVTVRLNSIGDGACRPQYVRALRDYVRPHMTELSKESIRRFEANPLRLLDSKEPREQALILGAPLTRDFLCDACRAHFEEVKRLFALIEIPYVEDPFVVRGLDYYTRTAVEISSGRLGGAQNAMLGGGRYDGLAEQLGGPSTPGVGFGQGVERLMLVLQAEGLEVPLLPPSMATPVFVVSVGEEPSRLAFRLLDRIRAAGVPAIGEVQDRSLRAQMKAADRTGARFAVILGEQEVAAQRASVRDLERGTQEAVDLSEVVGYLTQRTGGAA